MKRGTTFLSLALRDPTESPFGRSFWPTDTPIMGSVKVDEIGVSVGQKERPNGLSVGEVPPFSFFFFLFHSD